MQRRVLLGSSHYYQIEMLQHFAFRTTEHGDVSIAVNRFAIGGHTNESVVHLVALQLDPHLL